MATIEQLAIQFGDVVAVLDDFEAFMESVKTASSKHKYYWRVDEHNGQSYLKAVVGGQFMLGFESGRKTRLSDISKMTNQLKEAGFTGVRFVKLRGWATAVPP